MSNVVMFGPPGSGKGTQATGLVARNGTVRISTGELFKAATPTRLSNDLPANRSLLKTSQVGA